MIDCLKIAFILFSAKRSSLLPSDESGSKPSMSKRNSLVPGADKGRRSSLLPPGFKQNRRRSSARRNSTFDVFIQKKGGRKFSINDDDDDENKLGNTFSEDTNIPNFFIKLFSDKRWQNKRQTN